MSILLEMAWQHVSFQKSHRNANLRMCLIFLSCLIHFEDKKKSCQPYSVVFCSIRWGAAVTADVINGNGVN